MKCPNGHDQFVKLKTPVEVGHLLPQYLLDVLIERELQGKDIDCGKIYGLCLECGFVKMAEQEEDEEEAAVK